MYALYYWLSGEGCEVFAPEEGHVWLVRAAEAGSTEAQVELAHCYRLGDGVERDASRARELYRSAAAGGDADALAFLAELGDEE